MERSLARGSELTSGEQETAARPYANGLRGSLPARLRDHAQPYAVPIKFVLVGGLNTAFSYAVFAAIHLAGASDQLAVILATVAGVLFNYFSTGRLVFSHTGLNRLLVFVLGYAVVCVLNIAILRALAALDVDSLLGQLIAVPPLAVLAYFINSRLVFGNRA